MCIRDRARCLPSSLGKLSALGLSGPEIRYHGKTLLALVTQVLAMPETAYPAPIINLIDYPGYKKAFKAIKGLITQVSEAKGLSAELLASRRQINRLLNWHWKLSANEGTLPELLSGWRGQLYGESLRGLLAQYA